MHIWDKTPEDDGIVVRAEVASMEMVVSTIIMVVLLVSFLVLEEEVADDL